MSTELLAIPLALYVHIPWCVRKCPYCDFNSHELREGFDEPAYIDALIHDLEQDLPLIWGRRVSTVFFGGGTPSLLSVEGMNTLMTQLRARLNMIPGAEITLEANPGTAEQGKFAGFREAGINRLSIGVQSFQDNYLSALGRIHGGAEATAALRMARNAGFENVNLDLMFGLPGQGQLDALRDVQTAIDLAPEHISFYQLTLEPNTYFHSHPPLLPDDDLVADIQLAGLQLLADAGYAQYEVSATAKSGFECAHNTNYWTFGDYLGIGAGAHAKITDMAAGVVRRYAKQRQPKAYVNSISIERRISDQRDLSAEDLRIEFLMNALRLKQGFAVAMFEQRTGLSTQGLEPNLS